MIFFIYCQGCLVLTEKILLILTQSEKHIPWNMSHIRYFYIVLENLSQNSDDMIDDENKYLIKLKIFINIKCIRLISYKVTFDQVLILFDLIILSTC